MSDANLEKAFVRGDALVRTKRTWLLGLAVTVFAAGQFTVLLGFEIDSPGRMGHGGHTLLEYGFGALAFVYACVIGLGYAWSHWWRERRGVLRADQSGLFVAGRRMVSRSAVQYGYLVGQGHSSVLRLRSGLSLVDIAVANEAEGVELLTAMRLDGMRSVANYGFAVGTWRQSWIRAGIAIVPLLIAMRAVSVLSLARGLTDVLLVGWVLIQVLFAVEQRVRVFVGADGVRLRRPLRGARFLPFYAIDSAYTDGRDVVIRLNDGGFIAMHDPSGRGWGPVVKDERAQEVREFVKRIGDRLTSREGESADLNASGFIRAGRNVEEWLRAAGSAAEVGAFRIPASPPERLWRIVEDTAAPATARAGAAVALRRVLDDDGRVRLRAVAEACAGSQLRIALEAVASDVDEAELRTAFESLGDEEPVGDARVR